MNPVVRPARITDADGIAEVHVRSWQAAYRGLMPQEVLDGLSVAQRAEGWRRILGDPESDSRTLVAERELADAGHTVAYLWVLNGNERASAFYERHGWQSDGGSKVETRPNLVLDERRHVKVLNSAS